MGRSRLLAGLVVAAILAAGLAVASANDGETVAAAPAVMLEPGDNFVGWIEESISVENLFEAIPQIEVIYYWDAASRTWRIAAPAMPSSLWTLRSIEPGMAVLVRNGSDESVPWIPQFEPARGLIELHEGTNWVSWAGPDGWSIEQAAKGIGRSLSLVQRGIDTYDHAIPESANDWQPLARGDPLLVNVSRTINWLQPTYVMPTIEFPGGAAASVQRQVQDDLLAVLDFYADTYGVQVDSANLDILIPADFDSLVQYFETNDLDYDETSLKDLWDRAAGWAGRQIVVRQTLWNGTNTGRYVLSHEYFHHLQFQSSHRSSTPTWLVEGTASWVDMTHAVWDENAVHAEHIRSVESSARLGPSLRTTAYGNGTWQYPLGTLAVEQLVQASDRHAPLELYRGLVPQRVGPRNRWRSIRDWRDVLADVTGIQLDDFYLAFDAYQESLPGRTTLERQPGQSSMSGIVRRASGSPISGALVIARQVDQNVTVGWPRAALTDETGRFELVIPTDETYRLSAILREGHRGLGCRIYFADDKGRVDNIPEDIHVLATIHPLLDITVPDDHCRHVVRGRVTGPDGQPLSGFPVGLPLEPSLTLGEGDLSGSDGTFEVTVREDGTHRLMIELAEGCSVFWTGDGVTGHYKDAELIGVDSSKAAGFNIQVTEPFCTKTISGTIERPRGMTWSQVDVSASSREAGFSSWTWSEESNVAGGAEADVHFSLLVPGSGAYRLSAFVDGCLVHYTPTGVTPHTEEAADVLVLDKDVANVVFRLTDNPCPWRIEGRLVDGDGVGLPNEKIYAQTRQGMVASDWTESDGSFSVDVPIPGRYFLYTNVTSKCVAIWRPGGAMESRDRRIPEIGDGLSFIEVGDTGPVGISFVLADGVCS